MQATFARPLKALRAVVLYPPNDYTSFLALRPVVMAIGNFVFFCQHVVWQKLSNIQDVDSLFVEMSDNRTYRTLVA